MGAETTSAMDEVEDTTGTAVQPETDAADADDAAQESDDSTDDDGADALGDAGKLALDRMKAKWQTERDARKAAEAKLTTPDPNADVIQKLNQRLVRTEVRAAAKGKLSDPTDALKFINLDTFEVGDDGELDESAIAAAIDELVTKKPYLAAQGRRFEGGADGGARNASRPRQLSEADLASMTSPQILKAKADGQLADLLGK